MKRRPLLVLFRSPKNISVFQRRGFLAEVSSAIVLLSQSCLTQVMN